MENKTWELVLCSGAEHLEEEFVRDGFSVIKSFCTCHLPGKIICTRQESAVPAN